jgi:hypothetical protein
MKINRCAALVALAGLCAAASAQDSISNIPLALVGDGLDAYDDTQQQRSFVLDLAPLTTSWGTQFGIGPVHKYSRSPNGFISVFQNAYNISQVPLVDQPFADTDYSFWDVAGQGVNPLFNDAPGTIDATGMTGVQHTLGACESEGNYGGLVGSIINYDPANPSRLYVKRVYAAINGEDFLTDDFASLAGGSVDAGGDIAIRADNFGTTASARTLDGNYQYRVDVSARTGGKNVIDISGGSDGAATTVIGIDRTVTHATPSIIPESKAGRSIAISQNFNRNFVYESSVGVVTETNTHRNTRPGVEDHRGGIAFSPVIVFPNTVGTVVSLGHDDALGASTSLLYWGVDSSGTPAGTGDCILPFDPGTGLPGPIEDFGTGFSTDDIGFVEEFGHFRSQTAFNGGNGQVAIGRDRAGNLLLAAQIGIVPTIGAGNTGSENPTNALAVARVDSQGNCEWGLAAYSGYFDFTGGGTNPTIEGKPILDGPGGTAVGRLTEFYNVNGGDPTMPGAGAIGPSIAPPMMDSVGNIYFVSAVELFDPMGGPSDFDIALVRAVYDEATFSYELELIVSTGDVFEGQNSSTRYQIPFIELGEFGAGANSITSAAAFSGAIVPSAAHGQDPSGLAQADPRTLGGLTLTAGVRYDSDGDGMFDPQLDETYRTIVYIGDVTPLGGCYADCDGNEILDVFDFLCFQDAFVAMDPYADCDGNTVFDVFDFLCFQDAFVTGCP